MPSGPQFVIAGDSLSTGYLGTHPPDFYITLPQWGGANFTKTNIAVNGKSITDMFADAATTIDPLYASNSTMNLLLIWGGGNDFVSGGLTGKQTYEVLVQFAIRQRRFGWKVLVATLEDMPSPYQAEKAVYNSLITKYWTLFADGLVDIGGNANLGANGAYTNHTYFNNDGFHFTDTGYALAGSIEQEAIEDLVRNYKNGVKNPPVYSGRQWFTANYEPFAFYLQYSPTSNGIWMGQDSTGKYQFSAAGGGNSIKIGGLGDIYFQSWANAGRPTVGAGIYVLGYNTTANKMEYYNGSAWVQW